MEVQVQYMCYISLSLIKLENCCSKFFDGVLLPLFWNGIKTGDNGL